MKILHPTFNGKYGVEVYFAGDSNEDRIQNILTESAKEKKPVTFLFDLDGTLLESGLETENNPKTVEDWVNEHPAAVWKFRSHIRRLKEKTGVLFGICTGRGLEFTERVSRALFPEGTWGESIVEGGIFIYNPFTGEKRYAICMEPESARLLLTYRERIIEKIINTDGCAEVGKELAVSLNPPAGRDIYSFKRKVISLIGSLEEEIFDETGKKIDLINNLAINNSSTAIDITPRGASKLEAFNELSNGKIVGYFGDAENDLPAMGQARIKAAPANSVERVKSLVKTANIGLIASDSTIEGVNQILRLIKVSFAVYHKF